MKQAKWTTALLPRAVAALSLLSILLDAAAGCASSSEDERYRVVRKTDSDGKQLVVALGDNAKLFCHTSVPWKKCIWKPPRNGVKELRCAFHNDGRENHYSCPSFPEVHFDRDMSSSDMCAIVVNNIEEHHEGNWRCEFEVDNIDYEAGEPVMIRDRVRLMARGWRYP